METCGRYQAQLLDYLYDLVDEGDSRVLQDHLAQCGACQAALIQARAQQKLLAAAAKLDCSDVRFQAPPVEAITAEPEPPIVLPLPERNPSRRRTVIAGIMALPAGVLAAAAAILLAVALVAPPAVKYWLGYVNANHAIDNHVNQMNRANQDLNAINVQVAQLPQQHQKKLDALQHEVRERQLRLIVSGPESVQPGAPNEYQIHTQNLNGKTVPARIVSARVVNQETRQVVYAEENIESKGTHRLTLPPNLPVQPNTKLTLEVVARRDSGLQSELSEGLDLAWPVYLTHLTTDKPMYQPGETVFFRSLTLDRFTLKPPEDDFQYLYTITTPQNQEKPILYGGGFINLLRDLKSQHLTTVLGPDNRPVRGVGAGEYYLDPNDAGGEYTLTVSEARNRFPPQQRKFLVNKYEKARLNKELRFSRKSYGPGEEVVAYCTVSKAEKAEGGGLVNRPVTATVQIDGKPYGPDGKPGATPLHARTDDKGNVNLRFTLPTAIDKGQGSLTVTFDDGGNTETLIRPIPIVTKKLHVDFFPEGGDLAAGVPCRVYFQARTPLDKPADIKGRIVAGDRVVVSDVQTLTDADQPGINQGMGLFEFTPEAGGKYELKIDSPAGIEGSYPLPEVKDDGVVLSVPKGVSRAKDWLHVVVHSAGKNRSLLIGAYCRGRLLDHQAIYAQQGVATDVRLRPVEGTGGVYRITVFEERAAAGNRRELVPMAERLVYRRPAERLDMGINLDKKQYIPGDKVKMSIQAVSEKDEPVPAVVMVAVVDKSVLTMADEKTARTLPTHFFLTNEVRKPEELEYADFLLTSHPKAPASLDLLLGTQGWRRFAEQNPEKFKKDHKEDAERFLAVNGRSGTLLMAAGQPSPEVVEFAQKEQQKLEKATQKQHEDLLATRKQTAQALQEASNDPEYKALLVKAKDYEESFERFRQIGYPVAGVVLMIVALVTLIIALARNSLRPLPYCGVATFAAVVFLFLTAVEFTGESKKGSYASRDHRSTHGAANAAALEERQNFRHRGDDRMDVAGEAAPMPGGGVDKPADMKGAMPPIAPKADLAEADKQMPRDVDKDGKAERKTKLAEENLLLQKNRGADPADKAPAPVPPRLDPRRDQAAALEAARRFNAGRMAEGEKGDGKDRAPGKKLDPASYLRTGPKGRGAFDEDQQRFQPAPPFVVREYAHQHRTSAKSGERIDFTETLYWHPVLVLPGGQAEVSFDLCDSVTTFQVMAFGHTLDGRLGAVTKSLESRLPFTLEPKIPIEVTASDKIDIPLSIANNTAEQRMVNVRVSEHNGLSLLDGKTEDQLVMKADERTRKLFRFQLSVVEGEASLAFEGKTQPFAADSIRRTFRVVPEGFPAAGSRSDMLEGVAQNAITLPDHWIKGTLKLQVKVYPSTLADLQQGLESLLREPHGCFEQTSTANYPNLLILDYLKETNQSKPEVEQRARDFLARGYQKLTSFECPHTPTKSREGYEWFGAKDAAHEALTAYGLLQFRDMDRVHPVDKAMLERTRQYLMACKDGNGGFKRNPRAIDTFGRAPEHITNVYIVWALTESGKDDVDKELSVLTEQAKTSKDPYFLALVANSLLNRDKATDAVALLKTVAGLQKPDGHLDAEKTSITGSGGKALQIETTALAVLGWLKANRPSEFTLPLQNAVKWVGQQRSGQGSFGSTQSTILALKALIAYASANKKTAEGGELSLYVDDQRLASLSFSASAQNVLTLNLAEAEKHLKPGKNQVRVEMTGKNVFPYTLSWSYQTLKPVSAENCPVKLDTRLSRATANEGESVHLKVTLENVSGKGQGMAVAIIGLPAGLTLPEDMKQLKDLTRQPTDGSRPTIGAWETRGRELILYWRDLAPDQKIEVPLDLICRVPGEYRGPASRAYLYYNADTKHWIEPLQVSIKAKAE